VRRHGADGEKDGDTDSSADERLQRHHGFDAVCVCFARSRASVIHVRRKRYDARVLGKTRSILQYTGNPRES
jgi:hypothetical protein